MIKKISFVVCLLLFGDAFACKSMPSPPCLLIRCPGFGDMGCARLDPKFKNFENFFDVKKVRHLCGENFTFDVTPKVKIPLESIIFRFNMVLADSSFKKSPLDAVESFKAMADAIHKNPTFEKWLEKNVKERAEEKNLINY